MENVVWDNSAVYENFNDPKIQTDLEFVKSEIVSLSEKVKSLTTDYNDLNLKLAHEVTSRELDLEILLMTMNSYCHFAKSVDNTNKDAKALQSKVSKLFSEFSKALTPLHLFLSKSPEDYLNQFLDHPRAKEIAFLIRYQRTQNDFLLSEKEEVLVTGLSGEGLHAWGKLYTEIAGKLKVNIDGQTIGLAQAASLLKQNDRLVREKAYRGINQSWEVYQDTAAASLNAINGWRWEMNRARSKKRELHFLDKSCHQSRITRNTLNTMMDVVYQNRSIGQQGLTYMAQEIGVNKVAPWDLLAAMPENNSQKSELKSFAEGIDIIKKAFQTMNPEMADFVDIMVERKWIDGEPSNNRSPGAYCGGFAKLREPRIFMTYQGSMSDILTLAHEIGHAYHNWVLRDLSLSEGRYSMTLAETASIFAETLVKDYLLQNAKSEADKKVILWQECESASSLLINIPARFEFEKSFVELRGEREVNVEEIKEMMIAAQKKWYGETLTEYDPMFWASKLHFHMSGLGFYNYPYLFGYLFSLGIYAKKEEFGPKFSEKYISVLRDTGVMTAEDLVMKHFGEDISKSAFWEKSLNIVKRSMGIK